METSIYNKIAEKLFEIYKVNGKENLLKYVDEHFIEQKISKDVIKVLENDKISDAQKVGEIEGILMLASMKK